MLIPSEDSGKIIQFASLSRRVNANSQHRRLLALNFDKLIKKGEC